MKIHSQLNPENTELIQLLPDEKVLVQSLRSGCPLTFQNVYKMYSSALFGVIQRIVKSEEVAEDLLQEAFVKIWNSIEKYDESKGRFFTWMISMTRNLAIDHTRSKANLQKAKRSAIEDMTGVQFASYQSSMNPDAIGIRTLTTSLQNIEKEILDLIYFQGYSQSEAAEQLNLPLGTVKTKLRRAIGKLRHFFLPSEFARERMA